MACEISRDRNFVSTLSSSNYDDTIVMLLLVATVNYNFVAVRLSALNEREGKDLPIEHPLLTISLPVNLVIHGDHDDSRQPETDTGANHGIEFVHLEHAHVREIPSELEMLFGGVPAGEDGQEAHHRRRAPNHAQHGAQSKIRHDQWIVQRLHDRVISIHADAAQMKNRNGAEEHVQRVPHVAHEIAEQPSSGQLDRRVERHGENGHQHVSQRQRDHEVIGNYAKLPVPHYGHDHQ